MSTALKLVLKSLACLPAIVLSYREAELSKTSQDGALSNQRIGFGVARHSLRSKGSAHFCWPIMLGSALNTVY